jgi:predicted flap endonuclease-1-like 5' DNA nuclease
MGNEKWFEETVKKHLADTPEYRAKAQAVYDAHKEEQRYRQALKDDAQKIIEELNDAGISQDSDLGEIKGLGDLIHSALNKVGITEERFKKILGLKECGCSARRAFLNKLVKFKA